MNWSHTELWVLNCVCLWYTSTILCLQFCMAKSSMAADPWKWIQIMDLGLKKWKLFSLVWKKNVITMIWLGKHGICSIITYTWYLELAPVCLHLDKILMNQHIECKGLTLSPPNKFSSANFSSASIFKVLQWRSKLVKKYCPSVKQLESGRDAELLGVSSRSKPFAYGTNKQTNTYCVA